MSENNIASKELSFRGPLKYVVETSTSQLEAGRNTSIFLLITNPYDVPVNILSAQPKVPVHFKDTAGDISFWEEAWEIEKREMSLENKKTVSGSTLIGDSKNEELPTKVTLQPGNTIIYEFKLRTRQTIFFTPAVHNLNAQVQYEMGGTINHDAVKYQLNIRAPFKALIYGSVIGSIVGTLLRFTNEAIALKGSIFVPEFYLSIVTGILIGAVLVIAFARKKDAQPFITIEDFWGGFFIGFLAGYVGKSMLDTLVSKS